MKEDIKEDFKETMNETMNETMDETMNETMKKYLGDYNFFIKLSLSFGLLFMFTFYDMFQNFNGIFYPVFVAGLFILSVLALKKINISVDTSKKISSAISYAIMGILLGISSNLTMNYFVIFFNTVFIAILYGLFIVKCLYPNKEFDLFKIMAFYIQMFFSVLGTIHLPFRHFKIKNKDKKINTSKTKNIIEGVVIAFIFLSIVFPLLMSSDMIFANIFSKLLSNISKLFNSWFIYLFLTVIGTCGFYGLFYIISQKKEYNLESSTVKSDPIRMITMTWLVALVYLVYCVIQIVYLIGGNIFTLPDGLTYAEYARSGFFQLLAVAFINLSLVLLCVNKVKEDRWLDTSLNIISGSTFIMIASATYRMLLYINSYYLTFIRVLVLWFLLVLTICMIGIVYYIHNKTFYIYRYLFITGMIAYLIFGFMRVDYIVAKYNISHMKTIEREDMEYLLDLSLDAIPALENINDYQYINKLKDIKNDHKSKIRYFNFSRWIAYKVSKK